MDRWHQAAIVSAAATVAAVCVYLRRRNSVCEECLPHGEPQPHLLADVHTIRRLLAVIEHEILPKTASEVAAGNKVFGAAVLDGEGATVVADTNHETACPLYHGEVYTIEQWSALAEKPPAASCIFLATHEPCCLCISAIVWTGFKRCFFLYPYETTRDQGIPHDINIMYELWDVRRYRPRNKFCSTTGILPLIEALHVGAMKAELELTVARITATYDSLAHKYHTEKAENPANTMAFN
jgi:tRNA(Arg) A34 adenosine deaminase TadA